MMYRIIVLVFFLSQLAQAESKTDRIAAIVNGEPILLSEVKKLRTNYKELAQLDPRIGELPPERFSTDSSTLAVLIEQHLIDQFIKNQKWEASPADIDREIQRKTKELGIDLASLEKVLKNRGSSMEQYRQVVKSNIEKQTLFGREISPRIAVADEEIKSFYYQNYQKRAQPRKVHLIHLVAPKSAELQSKVQKLIRSSSSLQSVATKIGKSVETQDLGYIEEASLDPEFRRLVLNMKKGEISSVIFDSNYFHVFQIVDVTTGTIDVSWEKERDTIYNTLMQREFVKQLNFWIERQKDNSLVKINI